MDQDVILKDIYYDHEIDSVQPSSECVNGFTLAANNSVQLFSHPEASKIIEVCSWFIPKGDCDE